ncbi:MAG: hypothetical protein HQL33_01680 [Alphaproteobacteria bacterium]|nr:hypothetical protein [Alphaproteobacteria bacterium]
MLMLDELYDVVWELYTGLFSFVPFGSDYVAIATLMLVMVGFGILLRNVLD